VTTPANVSRAPAPTNRRQHRRNTELGFAVADDGEAAAFPLIGRRRKGEYIMFNFLGF
jgi:hypothetical protein